MDATFMTALHIRNVRHLKNIHIPLSQKERKSLILTGKNGSGKTSVLIALEKFLEYAVSSSSCSQEQCKSSIAHYENLLVQKSLTENDKIKIEQNRKHLTFWKDHLALWTDDSVAEYSSYADLRAKYQNGNYILAYYGDRREIKVNISDTIEKVDLKNVYTLTDHPSRELVKYLVNLKTTEAFAQTSGNTQRAAEIKNWFSRF